MVSNHRDELYSLSNQFIELFISDLLSKNKVKVDEVKESMSEEQREKLKDTVERLQAQVGDFLYTKDTKKTTTENEEKEPSVSPLRKKVKKEKAVETEEDESEE